MRTRSQRPAPVSAPFVPGGISIFLAGLASSSLFRNEKGGGLRYAFGSNLLVAFFVGFTEYLGLMADFNNLLLIIVAVYAASYLLTLGASRRPA